MSTRTIRECDRCHREVRGETKMMAITVHKGGRQMEMCMTCEVKFERFLHGAELEEEVPP